MTTYGLTSTGFVKPRIADIVSDLEDDFKDTFGDSFLVSANTPAGKQIGIQAERESLIWEALEAVYDGQYVDTAGGVSQDKANSLTGVTRQIPLQSTVTLYCAGTASTVIAKDSTVSVALAGDYFQLKTAVTLGTIGNKTISGITRSGTTATATTSAAHGLATGAYVFVSGSDQSDYNILTPVTVTAGTTFTFPVANSPTSPATGTMSMDEATAVAAESVEYGAIAALAGTLTVIENPITGWDRVENYADASTGRLEETDSAYRTRRDSSLALLGNGTIEAIKADLDNVSGVTSCVVYENPTGSTDGDGRDPYCIECLVAGGAAADIAECIFESTAGGTPTYGNETPETVTDSQGINHTINYSRLTEVDIYHDLVITTNSDILEGPIWDTTNGKTDLLAAIVAFYAGQAAGENVYPLPYLMAAIGAIDGIASIALCVGTTAVPTTLPSSISITASQIAVADSGDISGTIDGTPI